VYRSCKFGFNISAARINKNGIFLLTGFCFIIINRKKPGDISPK